MPRDGEADASIWIPMQSRTQGRPYYYHTESRETSWDKPDDFDENLPEDAPGWIEMESRSQGRYYYFNQETKECVWDRPKGVPEPPPFERPKPNPKREALRQVISDWADEFLKTNGREATEDDIPEGSEIARHHRDYRMLKQEEECERLKKEQAALREELQPDSRERLIDIKKALEELEPKIKNWKETKQAERERRDKVTTAYNSWIKKFQEEHGRGPTEKDIDPGSEIAEMFKEYTKYRQEAKRAKARQARIEQGQKKQQHEEDHRRIRQYMADFEAKHGRWPTQKDLPKGSEIAELYQRYLEGEMQLNPTSPRARREKLKRKIQEWVSEFEKKHERKPTRSDIQEGTDIAEIYAEYDQLSERTKRHSADKEKQQQPAEGRRGSGPKQEAAPQKPAAPRSQEYEGHDSPRAQYQTQKQQPAGCADCCSVM